MNTKGLKELRTRLWNQNPHCRKCGRVTVLPENLHPDPGRMRTYYPHMATIQHHYDRLHPERLFRNGKKRYALWCNDCNRRDSIERVKKTPKEVQRQLSKSADDAAKVKEKIYTGEIVCHTMPTVVPSMMFKSLRFLRLRLKSDSKIKL